MGPGNATVSEQDQNTFVEVTIGFRKYRIRGAEAPVLEALASRIDGLLGEIAGPAGHADDSKTAILAALNLSMEAEERRAEWERSAIQLATDSAALERRLTALSQQI